MYAMCTHHRPCIMNEMLLLLSYIRQNVRSSLGCTLMGRHVLLAGMSSAVLPGSLVTQFWVSVSVNSNVLALG